MKNGQSPLYRFLLYAKPHRMQIIFASTCSVLNTFFDILPEAIIGLAVNVVVYKKESFLGHWGIGNVFHQLLLLVALMFIIFCLESVFEYFYAILWRDLAQKIQHDLRTEVYDHIQSLPMAYYASISTGRLLSIINDDINQLEHFLDDKVHDFIQLVSGTVIIGAIFFYLSPTIACISLIPIPLVFWIAFKFQHFIMPRYSKVREAASHIATRLTNNILGMATIKSYAAQKYELKRVAHESEKYVQANHAVNVISSLFVPIVRMAIILGFLGAMVLGGFYVINGSLGAGAYTVLVFQTQRLIWPFARLAEMTDLYQRAMASVQRVLDLLEVPVTIRSGQQALPSDNVRGEIRFNDVSFAYAGGATILKNLSFSIPAGHTVAFVGPTGSGKTTLIKLLLRFYDPTQGVITLDGIDSKEYKLNDLRRAIGLVSQDFFLFEGTVAENIAYGTFDASRDAIINAAQIAEAHEFIKELPQGYDTIVGERGQKLSGGQRQRISIARAVVKNPPIFIFDEATSAVDNETEAAIQRSLEKISHDHTMIIIAHRLSTIRHAHTIFVLDKGVIIESGSHEDLVHRDGLYAALWRVQTGEHS